MKTFRKAQVRGLLREMAVLALVGGVCRAQVGPPVCPVPTGSPAASMRQPVRPTAEAIEATAAAGAADPSVLVSAEPVPNFGVERFRLMDYADCAGVNGCYWDDLDAQLRRAEVALDRLVAAKKTGERLAMVMDIDETSMSSYCELRREAYGFVPSMFNQWIVSPEASVVIPGALRLFDKARAAGVEVFFITGRSEEQTAATERNLTTAGYKGWKGLGLRKGPQKSMSTVEYKGEERQKIVDAGYRIVMSVGDQWSDLNGTPKAEISVKLPNPFYYLP